jgi:hypothetical protein
VWIDPAPDLPITSPTPDIGETTAIFVAFDGVQFHRDDGRMVWRSTSSGFIDLVDPSGLPVLLANWQLPDGHYTKMDFHVLRAGVVLGDLYFPLSVGNSASFIEVVTDFCVDAQNDVDGLELAWDAIDSLVERNGGYWLDPVITVHSAPVCTDDAAAK